jgi:UDP-N-acetylglucosamine 2-epimerase
MRAIIVIGTRPEMIKIWSVLQAFSDLVPDVKQYIYHTGQHYDYEMSQQIWSELGLAVPDTYLSAAGTSVEQTISNGIEGLSSNWEVEDGDIMVIIGDTASTLIGATVAALRNVPVVHIESGVRSFDYSMPEEIIRRMVDSIATVCFAPTKAAIENLKLEGRADKSGDTLKDAVLKMSDRRQEYAKTFESNYDVLVTAHRAGNVDDTHFLHTFIEALGEIEGSVFFPVHPRTHKHLVEQSIDIPENVILSGPVGYVEFLARLESAKVVITDSGGVQQEAAMLGTPCLTIRDNTEWVDTIEVGSNQLVGRNAVHLAKYANELLSNETGSPIVDPFIQGGGRTAVEHLISTGLVS